MNIDQMKLETEAISSGQRTIIVNHVGVPCVMNRFSKMKNSQLYADGDENIHPAFIVGEETDPGFYFGSFQMSVLNGAACSVPLVTPKVSINFDTAFNYCVAAGQSKNNEQFHLATRAEWAVVSMLSFMYGTLPHGNSNFGCDNAYSYEAGQEATSGSDGTHLVLTGSGPATWSHNHTIGGVYDMKGNCYEWQGGLRLNNGEINIMVDNIAANAVSHAAASTYWKAIMPDGSLVDPGTDGTLHFTTAGVISTASDDIDTDAGHGFKWTAITIADGVTIPAIMYELMLAPIAAHNTADATADMGVNLHGERLPIAGGSWHNRGTASVRRLYMHYPRSYVFDNVGARLACRMKVA